MTATKAHPQLRWSSVRDCPRKAVYEATDAPARERTEREERVLYRGRRLGRDYGDWLAAKYGEIRLQRERKVIWPLGVGHIDVFLIETSTAIEVLSSAHATPAMVRSKLLQLVGYMEHDEHVDNGCLVILNPSDFSEERVIVTKTSRIYADLAAEVRQRIETVIAWRDTGEMPPRVCSQPTDSWSRFCVYADHCFAGWERPERERIDAPEAQRLAVKLAHVKARRREISAADRTLEREQKDVQAELLEFVPPGEWQVGSHRVKRSPRVRQSFDLSRAQLDSRFHPDVLAEFTRVSTYDVWDSEQVAPSNADDYGDVPWDDDDLEGPTF